VESIRGSVELSGSSGALGVLGGDSQSWTQHGRLMGSQGIGHDGGSTWVDHVRSEWHMTRTSVTWNFRGGSRATW